MPEWAVCTAHPEKRFRQAVNELQPMIDRRYALLGLTLSLALLVEEDNNTWAETVNPPMAAGPSHGPLTGPDFAGLIANLQPQVLNIRAAGTSRGSGFVAHPGGYVLTALHVVQGFEEVSVTLDSREFVDADVVATDTSTDLAILKLKENPDWRPLVLDKKGDTRLAEWLLVLGNPFGQGPTASVGVVGTVGNTLAGKVAQPGWIQTDASINPGNSGGPVINSQGRVIGVATARISPGQGVGFATPIRHARRLLDAVLTER
jgi:S1-C subfamily serine protease